MARPRRSAAQSAAVFLRMSVEEKAAVDAAAREAGLTTNDYGRMVLLGLEPHRFRTPSAPRSEQSEFPMTG